MITEAQLTCDKETTELSSLMVSSTMSLLGLSFFFRMAVAKSSLQQNEEQEIQLMENESGKYFI